jgi:hypothetical protein
MTLVLLLVSLLIAQPANAQVSDGSFLELQKQIAPGDTIYVTDAEGETRKGIVQTISDSLLTLQRGPTTLTFRPGDVSRVTRRGHEVRNAALIGLAVGFLAGAVFALTSDDCTYTCFSSPAGVFMIGSLGGGVGLGVGAAVGKSRTREQVLLEKRSSSALMMRIAW